MKKGIVLILILLLAACSVREHSPETPAETEHPETVTESISETALASGEEETQTPSESEPETAKPWTLSIYSKAEAQDFKELDQVEKLQLQVELEGDRVRFQVDADDVDVRLDDGFWNYNLHYFRPFTYGLFELRAQKDKVYEFSIPVSEGSPSYRLVASDGEKQAVWYGVYDGLHSSGKIEIEGQIWEPKPLAEDEALLNMCKAYAYRQYDDEKPIADDPVVAWVVVQASISMSFDQKTDVYPSDQYGFMAVEEWILDAFRMALFPGKYSEMEAVIEDIPYQIVYRPDRHERYDVAYLLYDGLLEAEGVEVLEQAEDRYVVRISIIDYTVGTKPSGVMEVEVEKDKDAVWDQPFHYRILGAKRVQ